MPVTKSAKKALRQEHKLRAHNLNYKRRLKLVIKQVRTLADEKKTAEAKTALSAAFRLLDKAAKSKVIKRGTADRLKSRLSQAVTRS